MQFSIITPSLNASDHLKCCVASVADQGVECEHIVQDAGSEDGTLKWLPTDPRVRHFVEKDHGMYDAINRGIERATGDVVAWLNCDEQYLPGALESVREAFEQNPEVEVVFGDVVLVDSSGDYLCHRKVEVPLLYHSWVCHLSTLSCAMFFRRGLVASSQSRFNETYRCGGDGEWVVRMLRAGVRMISLGRFTSAFTLHGENLGRSGLAREEWRRLRATAPVWVRVMSPVWIAQHRLRRWIAGRYSQGPFEFAVYTATSQNARVSRQVSHPTFRCPY